MSSVGIFLDRLEMTCRASTARLLANAKAATLFHVGAIHRSSRNNRAATELSLHSNCTVAHASVRRFRGADDEILVAVDSRCADSGLDPDLADVGPLSP